MHYALLVGNLNAATNRYYDWIRYVGLDLGDGNYHFLLVPIARVFPDTAEYHFVAQVGGSAV
jgi:hypothetical protein